MNPDFIRVAALYAGVVAIAIVVILRSSEDAAIPAAARRRASFLLLSKLDRRQRWNWLVRRRFDVRSSSGRIYRISEYEPFNVRSGDTIFCLQVDGDIPADDKVLAQKLLLEIDESLFLKRANQRALANLWPITLAG